MEELQQEEQHKQRFVLHVPSCQPGSKGEEPMQAVHGTGLSR